MKTGIKWYHYGWLLLSFVLVATLLLTEGCGPGLIEQLETQAEDLQEQIDALEDRVTSLEEIPTPPFEPVDVEEYSNIRIPIEQFQSQPHIDVVMSTVVGGELTVTLGSNPTTGYEWQENAEISDKDIVEQVHHVFLSPGPDEPPGTPGEEVWVFKALKRGTTNIVLEYFRPWTGAGLWAVTITATIR